MGAPLNVTVTSGCPVRSVAVTGSQPFTSVVVVVVVVVVVRLVAVVELVVGVVDVVVVVGAPVVVVELVVVVVTRGAVVVVVEVVVVEAEHGRLAGLGKQTRATSSLSTAGLALAAVAVTLRCNRPGLF